MNNSNKQQTHKIDNVNVNKTVNNIVQQDCIYFMKNNMNNKSVDLTLTDIPYDIVNRKSNGLRNLDKGKSDYLTFDINSFLDEIYRVTRKSIIVFCSKEQFSSIYSFFANKKGTTRAIVWEKTNPSPMNGQHIYLSGVELAVWFKYSGNKTFNAHCKNTVFRFSNGKSKLHPTEKNHDLLKELILDNSDEQDIVFDPCSGSGSHLLVAKNLNRQYLGCEINDEYFQIAKKRLQ